MATIHQENQEPWQFPAVSFMAEFLMFSDKCFLFRFYNPRGHLSAEGIYIASVQALYMYALEHHKILPLIRSFRMRGSLGEHGQDPRGAS